MRVVNAAALITSFPDIQLAFELEPEAALEVLHRLLDREIRSRGEQEMEVVGHDYKCVEFDPALQPLVLKDIEEQEGIFSTWKRRRWETVTVVMK